LHLKRGRQWLILVLFLALVVSLRGANDAAAAGGQELAPAAATCAGQEGHSSLACYLARGDTPEPTWVGRLLPLVQAAERDEARVGLMVYDMATGRYYAYNAQELLIPASTIKLLTAAAALDGLGPEYRFRTTIAHDGALSESGELRGNLFLKGYGDPTLTTETLVGWADALVERGLRAVTGNLLLDVSFFGEDGQTVGQGWLPGEPQPLVGALSVNHNQVRLSVAPGAAAGAPAELHVEPALPTLVVHNHVVTAEAGGRATLQWRTDEAGGLIVEGRIPVGVRAVQKQATAQSPALYVGDLFRRLLAERGVAFAAETTVGPGDMPAEAQPLLESRSEPLRRVLSVMLKRSDNFISEQVLRTLGGEMFGRGDSQTGRQAVARFLENAGLSALPYVLCDGCGLRLDNELSADLLVGLLVFMHDHPHGQVFRDALAVAGVDGTLARRLRDTAAYRQVRAKTGSLLGVSALAGYITPADGRTLAFAILMNGPAARGWGWVDAMRRRQDDMVLEMLSWP